MTPPVLSIAISILGGVNRTIWRTMTHTHSLHTTSWWFIGHRSSSPGKTYSQSHMLPVTWPKYN
ncbi:hypothetical protein L208DRAFT_1387907 [Tricholoma matsutake]|nr:hypothetical protein L208DRAFT_1387907 [Tricholoma matsutake 945]